MNYLGLRKTSKKYINSGELQYELFDIIFNLVLKGFQFIGFQLQGVVLRTFY